MLTTKELFNEMYTIEKMNRNSLTIVNNKTGEYSFISRNAYNALLRDEVVDMREREHTFYDQGGGEHFYNWVEVLVWKSI